MNDQPLPSHWGRRIPQALFDRLSATPRIGPAVLGLGAAVTEEVDPTMLEVVALRVAAVRESLYEWRAHCWFARRPEVGFSVGDIARIAVGPPLLTGAVAAAAQGVDDVLLLRRLGGRTRQRLGDDAPGVQMATLFYDLIASVMHGAPPDIEAIPGIETPALAAAALGFPATKRCACPT